ncbi:HAD-IIA family hydrolase [Gulosibacter hominis]|uniref:HAD-IIA family hydrolase n=1 Tax=Gulosibacter hominis TaxID=2770504 RepID=UPI001918F150|nr:HAD-IIA family hydrolase [Gulosibacter hominis]
MRLFGNRTDDLPAPVAAADALLVDLDGVVYRGANAVPHAVEALNAASDRGTRVGYITNNASRTDADVAEHLRTLGLRTEAQDVVTSPQAAVRLLSEQVPTGSLVLVVGGAGLVDELVKAGYRVTRQAADEPDAVLQGFAPDVNWLQLAEASYALRRDIPWIATNQDWTIPREQGIAPGNGTLVSAVHTATQKMAQVAGKPETALFTAAQERFGVAHPLMIGDRLDTDIRGANRAGIASALVLTGIDQAKQLFASGPEDRPDYIIRDLRSLTEPYPKVEVSVQPELVEARVRKSRVVLDGISLRVRSAGNDEVDLLRAACAAIWNSDKVIYALEIPASLLEMDFSV